MNFRSKLEAKIGKIEDLHMDFAVRNLNLEIEHKFDRMPTPQEMLDILENNIRFARKHNDLEEVLHEISDTTFRINDANVDCVFNNSHNMVHKNNS